MLNLIVHLAAMQALLIIELIGAATFLGLFTCLVTFDDLRIDFAEWTIYWGKPNILTPFIVVPGFIGPVLSPFALLFLIDFALPDHKMSRTSPCSYQSCYKIDGTEYRVTSLAPPQ